MGQTTGIEWTDATWNPVSGCTKVSQGCKFCYAERVFPRAYSHDEVDIGGVIWPRRFQHIKTHPDRLDWPLRWGGSKQAQEEGRPSRIFVNSMSDLFHEQIEKDFMVDAFRIMETAKHHIFQVLTKRPKRMQAFVSDRAKWNPHRCPADNVWLGVSVEDQATADERIPLLLQTPAAVRFVSYEPALGPVDLRRYLPNIQAGGVELEPWLDWVIAGGESGPRARPSHPDWFRNVREQCQAAGVPFFFKQWGEWRPGYSLNPNNKWVSSDPLSAGISPVAMEKAGKKSAGRLLDGREWNEFPKGGIRA